MKKASNSQDELISLYILLGQTRDILHKVRVHDLADLGVTSRQVAVMTSITELGGVASSAQISRRLIRERHSIHELLGRMEQTGLVERVNIARHKNRVKAVMTEKGREIYDVAKERKSVLKVMSCLSKEQRKQLKEILDILRAKSLKEVGWKEKVT